MTNCSIPWGAHTMVYKEFLLDGEAYLSKTVRNSDGLVSFGIHNTKNDHGIIFDNSMILVNADGYDEGDDEKYISKLKKAFFDFLSAETGIPVEELVSAYA